MDFQDLVKEVWIITDELYIREFSNNVFYEECRDKTWTELCERAIAILNEIK